jgi:hypothetical protein
VERLRGERKRLFFVLFSFFSSRLRSSIRRRGGGGRLGKNSLSFLSLSLNSFKPQKKKKWACVPASALVAFLLLGIEEIGVAIEEPFSILPLENMWADVDSEIRALAAASGAVSSMMLSWEFDEEEKGVEEEGGEGREGAERALAAGGAAR